MCQQHLIRTLKVTQKIGLAWDRQDGSVSKKGLPDDKNSILGTHTVKGENQPPQVVQTLHVCSQTCAQVHTH